MEHLDDRADPCTAKGQHQWLMTAPAKIETAFAKLQIQDGHDAEVGAFNSVLASAYAAIVAFQGATSTSNLAIRLLERVGVSKTVKPQYPIPNTQYPTPNTQHPNTETP